MSLFVKIFALLAFFAISLSAGPVSVYGALKACTISNKGQICGSGTWANTAVQVRGVSLGWSNTDWESAAFFTTNTVNQMVDNWKAEIIRVPMGHALSGDDEWYGSYTNPSTPNANNKTANMNRVKTAINAAIAKDAYVIIDWHSHKANSAKQDALDFFKEMAEDYGNYDNVIFEIFNEPLAVSWATIKSYADDVITEIRKHSNNLILVGTPNWDQNVNAPVGNWLSDGNVAYVLHFYAASHFLTTGYTSSGGGNTSTIFQSAVNAVLNAGKSVFVSEYGTVSADGNGSHDGTSSDAWMTYLNNNKISYCAWHVNNKGEASAFFNTSFSANSTSGWATTSNMTTSGQYIYSKLVAWASDAPWRSSSPQPSSSSGSSGGSSSSGSSGGSITQIDNFQDDGDGISNTLEYWIAFTDREDGGASTISNTNNGTTTNPEYVVVVQDGGEWVAKLVNYSLSQGNNQYDPYVALSLEAKNNGSAYDLSKCTNGFRYSYKGSAHNFKVKLSTITDHAHYYVTPAASANWKTEIVASSALSQPTWGDAVNFDPTKINAFDWEVKGGTSATTGNLAIKDFYCLGNMPLPQKPSSSSGNSNSSSSGNQGNQSSSSSDNGSTPIITLPQIAFTNSATVSKNGINLAAKDNAVIEVFGLNGSSLRRYNFANGVYTVSFSDLPKGLYIVKVSFGSEKRILRMPVN